MWGYGVATLSFLTSVHNSRLSQSLGKIQYNSHIHKAYICVDLVLGRCLNTSQSSTDGLYCLVPFVVSATPDGPVGFYK